MTTTSADNDRIVVSYVRQPDEHIAVMRRAGRRLAARRPANAYDRWGLLPLWAIGGGAGLAGLFHVLRAYLFVPVFGISPSVDEGEMMMIWLVPTLIVYVLIVLYSRWLTRRRLAAMRSRIRPDITITVTMTPEGASWNSAHTSMWLAWSEITNIGRRDGRIEFDLEAFVTYIPVSAFSNQGEQDAALRRILGFWKAERAIQP
ncbi:MULTISPECIES: hypothetical protein [Rhizobium]|uniref:hypothetical protein n=1 Tax=Rhizobium TaxID=379 RepID=UPI00195823B5|nr:MULTISPECIES: hypothetical protein [Rhizobium]MBM7050367.1 hypothetical protein [Rhizobium lusitanum]